MDYQQRGKKFDEFTTGDVFITAARTVTETDVVNFAGVSGDFNPVHMDSEYACKTPFRHRIAHGLLGVSIASGLITQLGIFEGTILALLSQTVHYQKPLFMGETIHLEMTVKEKKESSQPGQGIVAFEARLLNQKNETIMHGEWTAMMVK